ncbi:hypothetical protein KOR42_36130 [Thalassoglobus neptunius]|uniref:Uncharacterized protein n=1 Tax=Thalassoglobus neptunius TaxID=1938619 RepID=A0A5C5WHN3_9PLAN|nr:hypothetical protein [Thalassoglobus neptunius]TWT50067.1 hypothetical protein KOR42_36130 [Thalassoglobus neptunius]
MSSFVDEEHVRGLVHSSGLEVLPAEFAQLAFHYLENHFPIQSMATTSIIDWENVRYKTLDWANSTDDEAALWAKGTLAGKCTLALLVYSETVASVLGPFELMIRNLDTLIWKAPGCRLLLGVERSEDGTLIFTDGIIETDGKGRLFASQAVQV